MRDVETLTARLAKSRHNHRFRIAPSRLWEIERTGRVPNLFQLGALAYVYKTPTRKLLALYGI